MQDMTLEIATPADTTAALSHLVALGLARQDGIAVSPAAENLFLIRWLATAQKQKRFPRSVAMDIRWMLERGRKYGIAGKLRQHLDYLWRSCSGNLTDQSDLFRLTYATEILKDQGWEHVVLDAREWREGVNPIAPGDNGFYVDKAVLNAAYDEAGNHLHPFDVRIVGNVGNVDVFIDVMHQCDIKAHLTLIWPRDRGHAVKRVKLLTEVHYDSIYRP